MTESVLIQQESRNHNILNSKSEYNWCALPRLSTKLGEEDFEAWRKEKLDEKRKEEDLERKIRMLRKERNRDRKQEIHHTTTPAEKRRKIKDGKYKTVKQMLQGWKPEERNIEAEREIYTEKERKKKKN